MKKRGCAVNELSKVHFLQKKHSIENGNPLLSVLKRLEALTGLRAHEMFDYCIGKDNKESWFHMRRNCNLRIIFSVQSIIKLNLKSLGK